jgi:hypothetical protein
MMKTLLTLVLFTLAACAPAQRYVPYWIVDDYITLGNTKDTTTSDIVITFGGTNGETLMWDTSESHFAFSDDLSVAGYLSPSVDATYDLGGGSSVAWNNAWIEGSIGDDSCNVNILWVGQLNQDEDDLEPIEVGEDLNPLIDDSYDLGASGTEWAELWVQEISDGDGTVSVAASMSVDGDTFFVDAATDHIGIGGIPLYPGRLSIVTSSTEGHEAIQINQNDDMQSFISFFGQKGNGYDSNITETDGDGALVGPHASGSYDGWVFTGMVRIEVNYGTYWIPYYFLYET